MAEHDFDITTTTALAQSAFWEAAFLEEFAVTWGAVKKFQGQLASLAFARAAVCWVERTANDLAARKQLLAGYTKGVLNAETISRYQRMLPAQSVAPKYLDNLCTVYNRTPQRVFSKDEAINKAFDSLYAEANVDARLRDAYRYAVMTNVVLVRPVFVGGRMKVRLLTPDLFRVVPRKDDDQSIGELWVIHAKGVKPGLAGPSQETQYKVWAVHEDGSTSLRIVDYQGETISAEAGKYGRIPYAVLRLEEPTDQDFYGAGETDLIELNVWRNMMRLFSSRNGIFQAFSIAIATNMGLTQTTDDGRSVTVPLGPDQVVEVEHNDPETAPPSLEYATPTPTFQMLEEYARNVVREKLRELGLPGFSVDEGAGTPPTGAALEVLERELVEKRVGHSNALRAFEREFAELVSIVARVDGGRAPATMPDVLPEFSVKYSTSRRYLEPWDELELDLKLAAEGLQYPSTVVAKYVGVDGGLTDEGAVVERLRLKGLWQGEAASGDVSGTVGALVAVTQLQKDVKAGLVSREDAMATAVQFLNRTQEQAAALFGSIVVMPTEQPNEGNIQSGTEAAGETGNADADGGAADDSDIAGAQAPAP